MSEALIIGEDAACSVAGGFSFRLATLYCVPFFRAPTTSCEMKTTCRRGRRPATSPYPGPPVRGAAQQGPAPGRPGSSERAEVPRPLGGRGGKPYRSVDVATVPTNLTSPLRVGPRHRATVSAGTALPAVMTSEGPTLKTHQAVRTGIRAAAVAVVAAALLPVLGAGPAAAASDITFLGVPALGSLVRFTLSTPLGPTGPSPRPPPALPARSLTRTTMRRATTPLIVAVDFDGVEQPPGTCAVTATDSTGSATATFDTEGQDQVIVISSPPSPALAGGTYLAEAFAFSGDPVTFSIASSSTDNCTVGTSEEARPRSPSAPPPGPVSSTPPPPRRTAGWALRPPRPCTCCSPTPSP